MANQLVSEFCANDRWTNNQTANVKTHFIQTILKANRATHWSAIVTTANRFPHHGPRPTVAQAVGQANTGAIICAQPTNCRADGAQWPVRLRAWRLVQWVRSRAGLMSR